MASNAATDGGIASGECTSREFRFGEELARCACAWGRGLCECAVSCFDLMGICTALEGVFGRATAFVVVALGGLPLGGDNLSGCKPFRLPMVRSFEFILASTDLEEATSFSVDSASFLLGEDTFGVVAVREVGGTVCFCEYKKDLGTIIITQGRARARLFKRFPLLKGNIRHPIKAITSQSSGAARNGGSKCDVVRCSSFFSPVASTESETSYRNWNRTLSEYGIGGRAVLVVVCRLRQGFTILVRNSEISRRTRDAAQMHGRNPETWKLNIK